MHATTMAWRSLARNRRRTLITSFSVAFGILLAVTFTGAGDYSYTNMINTSAAMGFGHLSISAPGANDRPSLSRWLPGTEEIAADALRQPAVTGAFPRIIGQAMFSAGARSAGAMFMAIDPAQEGPAHNFFLRALVAGEMFDDGQGRGAVVGSELATKLRLQPGRRLVLTVTDKDGELTSELLRVSAIFHTGDHGADAGVVLLPLDRMRDTLGYGGGGATLVAVYADDLRRVETIRTNLARLFSDRRDLEVLTWRETQADLSGLIAVDRLFNYLIQLLVGLVIAAGIMNTMHMSVLERSREFGIMLALGMAPGQTVRLVLVESFWLGCLGLVLGVLITAPWFAYMSRIGIDLSSLVGRDYSAGGVLVDPVMKLRLFAESGLAILAAIFALTLAAALYPAVRAGKVPPAQAIKEA